LIKSVWHLATNNLAGRPGRTALLAVAVTLATTLSVLVAVSVGTLQHSYSESMGATAGTGDVHIRHRSYQRIDARQVMSMVRNWPDVEYAAARYEHRGQNLELPRSKKNVIVTLHGVEPEHDRKFFPVTLLEGRYIEKDGEAVLDGRAQQALDAKVGDVLDVEWQETKLTVVGIVEQPPMTVLQLPGVTTTLGTVQEIAGYPNKIRKVEIRVKQDTPIPPGLPGLAGEKPTVGDALMAAHQHELPEDAVFEAPANVRAGINRGVKWTNLIGQIITVLVCLATAFIIVTGLTTAVTERTRELAIMRCIGTGKLHIGAAQVVTGGFIAALGALFGTPLGIGLGYLLYLKNHEVLSAGFILNVPGILNAILATILAGLVGALYPAVMATRVQPLEALAARARQPRTAGIIICLVLGLLGALFEPAVLYFFDDAEQAFWIYLPYGLGVTFFGYCLLCVPVLYYLAPLLTSAIAKVLRLPRVLLHESVMATPFRHGLTAGALMMGLAMLVAIWTEGGNVLYGWFNTIKMPDAFLKTTDGLTPDMLKVIRETPGVTATCAIRAIPVQTRSVTFGIATITPPYTLFAASDVAEFLEMTDIEWIEGDKTTALKKLEQGKAVLVGREYYIARGMGVGAKVKLKTFTQGDQDFEIAGVVGAVGLDVAVSYYGIGGEYAEASVSTVFGTRADGATYFNIENPDLVLLTIDKDADEIALLDNLTKTLAPMARGVVQADSSRTIKRKINALSVRLMTVASSLALATLLIASFGVANLIVAEIYARRFEYGVIRAIGGQKGMLGRLIAGQTLVIAIVACITGTALGAQIALVAKEFHRRLVGITYDSALPWGVVAWGALIVIVMALGAAAPAMWRLMRKQPTTLLAADA